MDYVKLLPLINKVSVSEAIKLKLLRLCLGELGQSTFDARRLDEASSMDEALNHLNSMWGTEDNLLTKYNQPLHEAAEDLLYRDELKHLLQRHAPVPRITSTTTVGSLKNASLIAAGESVERIVEKRRALVHAETHHEVALVTEETGLLEKQPYECLSPSTHQCDDQVATCSVSVTYSYENTYAIGLSEQNAFAQTATGESSVVDETERQVTLNSPSMVRPYLGTGVLDPAVKSSPHQKVSFSTANPSPRVHPYEDTP